MEHEIASLMFLSFGPDFRPASILYLRSGQCKVCDHYGLPRIYLSLLRSEDGFNANRHDDAMTTVVLCLTLAVILLTPPIVAGIRGVDRDWLGVPTLFAFMMIMGYIAPAYDVVHQSDLFLLRYPGDLNSASDAVNHALSVVCLGALAFEVAWYWPVRAGAVPQTRVWWRVEVLKLAGMLFTALGLVFFAVGVAIIGGPSVLLSGLGDRIRLMQGLNYLFQAINLLAVVTAVWWMWLLTTGRRILSPAYWAFAAFSLAMVALQGSKSLIFIFVLVLAILYHRLRRRIPLWVGFVAAPLLFVVLTLYALTAREYFAVGEFVTVAGLLDPVSVWNALRVEFLGNFIQLQTMSVLVEHVPRDLSYQFGKTYLSLLTMPIPRGIWPDKPLPSAGVFTLAFWPNNWLNQGTSIPTGGFGEMYLNFGYVGVLAGGALFGRVGRRILLAHQRFPLDPRRALIYALFVAVLPHYVRGEISVIVTVLVLLLPALVLLLLAVRVTAKSAAEAPARESSLIVRGSSRVHP